MVKRHRLQCRFAIPAKQSDLDLAAGPVLEDVGRQAVGAKQRVEIGVGRR